VVIAPLAPTFRVCSAGKRRLPRTRAGVVLDLTMLPLHRILETSIAMIWRSVRYPIRLPNGSKLAVFPLFIQDREALRSGDGSISDPRVEWIETCCLSAFHSAWRGAPTGHGLYCEAAIKAAVPDGMDGIPLCGEASYA
jgi:hypothetical protein